MTSQGERLKSRAYSSAWSSTGGAGGVSERDVSAKVLLALGEERQAILA
jgi:hypothetical protein